MAAMLYGIANCDTVKKARRFLDENGIAYTFHDYKKAGVDEGLLRSFFEAFGREAVVNTRGTTWRKLPEETKTMVSGEAGALAVLMDNPSAIKRPIYHDGDRWLIGFDPASWATLR